jgi:hypothetical protein
VTALDLPIRAVSEQIESFGDSQID